MQRSQFVRSTMLFMLLAAAVHFVQPVVVRASLPADYVPGDVPALEAGAELPQGGAFEIVVPSAVGIMVSLAGLARRQRRDMVQILRHL